MRKMFGLLVVLTFVCGAVAMADPLEKGDSEIQFTFDYSNTSPDDGDSYTTWSLTGAYGYMITKGNELGFSLDYSKSDTLEIESDDVDINAGTAVDGMSIGIWYNYNFRAGDMFNPYVGANYIWYTGDIGDFFDSSYGVQGGVKVWPWENAGMNFGMNYQWNTGAGDILDATQYNFFAGILIKF